MDDIGIHQLYIGTAVSLAILVVPGIVIGSYWWWEDRKKRREEMLNARSEENQERDRKLAA